MWRALGASIGIRIANGNLEETKKAIDYAFDLDEYIRYTEKGHDFIIDAMIDALEYLNINIDSNFSLLVANYVLEQAEQAINLFEDDWSWTCSLEQLKQWISSKIRS